jgi:hypothetical protein
MKITGMSAPTEEEIALSRAAKRWLADTENSEITPSTVTEPVCICWETDESTWTRYGDAVEPGSQMEPNPDCPEHFPDPASV